MGIENTQKIEILPVGSKTVDCAAIIQWAETWDWGVGNVVAGRLNVNEFDGWEAAIVLTVDEQYAGFCFLEKHDAWGTDLDPAITPFITAVYIDPRFRGRRLSEKLLNAAFGYARSLEFEAVYLISGEKGFYEKYGFEKFAQTVTRRSTTEPVYRRRIN
ncbi:MAG: GNAT family N-acetyltransferase [Clostridiales bacterium]|jgi:GNAT superfamily N-acetyltransferase|nr:GNAT family N-acetyltransferase [Clostridiales bacterium]